MKAGRHQMFISNTHRLRQRPNPDWGVLHDLQQHFLLLFTFKYSSAPAHPELCRPSRLAVQHMSSIGRRRLALPAASCSVPHQKHSIWEDADCWLWVVGSCFPASIFNSQTSRKKVKKRETWRRNDNKEGFDSVASWIQLLCWLLLFLLKVLCDCRWGAKANTKSRVTNVHQRSVRVPRLPWPSNYTICTTAIVIKREFPGMSFFCRLCLTEVAGFFPLTLCGYDITVSRWFYWVCGDGLAAPD